MNKFAMIMILMQVPLFQYGQIIADHTVIGKFDDIPQSYIDEVKKMLVWFPGESHSAAYRTGMELLEALNPVYACNVGTGEDPTDQYVRVENNGWIGEATWFTWYAYPVSTRPSASTTIKNRISSYNTEGHPFNAVGFAWCSDMVFGEGNESEEYDPVYGSRWYGASKGGPEGDMGWGLDGTDYSITGNSVNLTTYFGAMEEYITHCNTNGYPTRIIFTTGPVDEDGNWIGEGAYQGHIKHEAIRTYVKADQTKILFDYADILSYDENGALTTQTWNGHIFPSIATTNGYPKVSAYHISEAGAIRLAKAQWWLLARIAGWDGSTSTGINNIKEELSSYPAIEIFKNEIKITFDNYWLNGTVVLVGYNGNNIIVKKIDSSLCTINTSQLFPGIYLIVLSKQKNIITRKVVI